MATLVIKFPHINSRGIVIQNIELYNSISILVLSDVSQSTLTLLWLHISMIYIFFIFYLSIYFVLESKLDLLERPYGCIIKSGILDLY